MKNTATAAEIKEARETLLNWIKPGDTVYTIQRSVSRSGMQRHISLVIFRNGQALHPNYSAAKLLGRKLNRKGPHDSIIMNGCGMDMGFSLVYDLSSTLFPEGHCAGSTGKRAHQPHTFSPGSSTEPKGCKREQRGYALRHEWL